MADDITKLTASTSRLTLMKNSSSLSQPPSGSKTVGLDTLSKVHKSMVHSASRIQSLADWLEYMSNTEEVKRGDPSSLEAFRQVAEEVAEIDKRLSSVAEQQMLAHIRLLAKQSSDYKTLVAVNHFEKTIVTIAQGVFHESNNPKAFVWKVLAQCYDESTKARGRLQHKFVGLPTPDCWTHFWIQAIGKCYDGPTFFYPQAPALRVTCELSHVPQYLFRTYDEESHGQNNEKMIASAQSTTGDMASSKIDILLLGESDAADMLMYHLDPDKHTGYNVHSDNLVSWSSSLLFVLRCAIWRLNQGRSTSCGLKICVIDTEKFPPGQFIRDRSLLETYRHASAEVPKFIGLRKMYDNGEYLSQGRLHHAGRSCAVSLDQLQRQGLFDLYSELKGPRGWTKFVHQLRQQWSDESPTSYKEVKLASNIATECFAPFADDMALQLLSFKKRVLSGAVDTERKHSPTNDTFFEKCEPDEVRRYAQVASWGRKLVNGPEDLYHLCEET